MNGKRIGYARVSTVDQNPERQLENVQLDKKFTDYASGSSTKRPQLQQMLEFVREDDIVFIHSMDRLGRNLKDIKNLVDYLLEKKVKIEFIKENLKFASKSDPVANCVLNIFGAVAEFEYSLLKERQMEGIRLAQKAGKYKGRQTKLDEKKIEFIKEQLKTRISKTKIAEALGISRFSLYNYIAIIEKEDLKKAVGE